MQRAAGCRVRAGALSQLRDGAAQRHAVRESMELPRHRHGARLGHSTRRDQRHHRRRARQRHGVSHGHGALQLAVRVPGDPERAALSRARPRRRAVCRRAGARSERIGRASSRRATSSGTTSCRSISMATARTSPAPIGQLTNNNNGIAGMAYNVRLMPVKIIQGMWDEIFGEPVRWHRRRGGARHPLRRRQRRQGVEPEHRPHRRAAPRRW